jgi:hypothetical protein
VKLITTSAAQTIQTQIAASLVPGAERSAVTVCGAVGGIFVGCMTGGETACPQLPQNFAVSGISALQCWQSISSLKGCVIQDGVKTGLTLTAVGPEFESQVGGYDGEYEKIFQRVRKIAQI